MNKPVTKSFAFFSCPRQEYGETRQDGQYFYLSNFSGEFE